MEANPQRVFASCLLTNMEVLEVFELRRREDELELAWSSPVNLLQGVGVVCEMADVYVCKDGVT